MHKKIAFIATGYILKYDGISVYTENLLDAFLQMLSTQAQNGCKIDIFVGKSVVELIEKRVLDPYAESGIAYRLIAVDDRSFFHKMAHLYLMLLRYRKYDLVFATNFMPLILPAWNVVKVIHDLSPETNPHLYSKFHRIYHAFLLKSAKRFDRAIGYISETTREDLQKFYNIGQNSRPLLYLPNGVPFKVRNYPRPDLASFEEKFDTKRLNLLVVGRLNRAKGVDRILQFCTYFDRYLSDKGAKRFAQGAVIHFTGKQTKETTDLFCDAKFQNIEIVFDGFLEDRALNERYQKAHFCLFLSRNEGYGLPLVEAMWFRTVPVLSDIPIFREIMQSGYPLFGEEQGFARQMTDFMIACFEDPDYRRRIHCYIEEILAHECAGYRRAAENLATYIGCAGHKHE